MLLEFLPSLLLVIAFAFGLINGDVTYLHCQGELKMGKLQISPKVYRYLIPGINIPRDCTSLEIREGNGAELNWEFLESNTNTTPLDRVTSLTIRNVQVGNWTSFIQKFNSLMTLTMIQNFEIININDILQSKSLASLSITNASLTSHSVTTMDATENLKALTLTNCMHDSAFKDNAWKVMPNLTTLEYIGITLEELDLNDLSVYKQLTKILLTNVDLSFGTRTNPLNTLVRLGIRNCEFDLSEFPQFVANTFTNLACLNVFAESSRTKLTKEFLNDILTKFPDIHRVELKPFDIGSHDRKGTFEITYSTIGLHFLKYKCIDELFGP